MDNVLLQAMSDKDIAEYLNKFKDNESVITLLNGILATRKAEAEAKKAEEEFTAKLLKLAKLPAPPANIHNVGLFWREVEVPQGEPEEVEVIKQIDGKDTKVKETRQPTTKVWQWVTETNVSNTKLGKSNTGTDTTTKTSKRAITLNKRNGNVLNFVGNFKSGSAACEHLKLNTGGDSANRVLQREGYIIDPYNGTDFTS